MPSSTVTVDVSVAREASGIERRTQERFPTSWTARGGPVAEGLEPKLPARVLNVSAGGVGLLTQRPFNRGTVLVLKVPRLNADCPGTLFARVVHSRCRGPNEWVIGCAFATPLDDDELRALIS